MGNLGWSEMLLLMVFALVIFGPSRLPDVARQIGKAIREVRRVSGDFEKEVRHGLALDDDKQDANFPFMRAPLKPKKPTGEVEASAESEAADLPEGPAPGPVETLSPAAVPKPVEVSDEQHNAT